MSYLSGVTASPQACPIPQCPSPTQVQWHPDSWQHSESPVSVRVSEYQTHEIPIVWICIGRERERYFQLEHTWCKTSFLTAVDLLCISVIHYGPHMTYTCISAILTCMYSRFHVCISILDARSLFEKSLTCLVYLIEVPVHVR